MSNHKYFYESGSSGSFLSSHCYNILSQINAIKERVKGISTLEREITKYINDGKEEYKEVTCLLVSYLVHLCFLHVHGLFENYWGHKIYRYFILTLKH